jgi:hypothetical protein
MKKRVEIYEAPAMEFIELEIERGFSLSGFDYGFGDYENGGQDDYLD